MTPRVPKMIVMLSDRLAPLSVIAAAALVLVVQMRLAIVAVAFSLTALWGLVGMLMVGRYIVANKRVPQTLTMYGACRLEV